MADNNNNNAAQQNPPHANDDAGNDNNGHAAAGFGGGFAGDYPGYPYGFGGPGGGIGGNPYGFGGIGMGVQGGHGEVGGFGLGGMAGFGGNGMHPDVGMYGQGGYGMNNLPYNYRFMNLNNNFGPNMNVGMNQFGGAFGVNMNNIGGAQFAQFNPNGNIAPGFHGNVPHHAGFGPQPGPGTGGCDTDGNVYLPNGQYAPGGGMTIRQALSICGFRGDDLDTILTHIPSFDELRVLRGDISLQNDILMSLPLMSLIVG